MRGSLLMFRLIQTLFLTLFTDVQANKILRTRIAKIIHEVQSDHFFNNPN